MDRMRRTTKRSFERIVLLHSGTNLAFWNPLEDMDGWEERSEAEQHDPLWIGSRLTKDARGCLQYSAELDGELYS